MVVVINFSQAGVIFWGVMEKSETIVPPPMCYISILQGTPQNFTANSVSYLVRIE
jgi:hypothetical protein